MKSLYYYVNKNYLSQTLSHVDSDISSYRLCNAEFPSWKWTKFFKWYNGPSVHKYVTKNMEQNLSREADSYSASQ